MQHKGNKILDNLDNIHTDYNRLDAFLNYDILKISNFSLTPGKIILILVLTILTWLVIRTVKRIMIGKRNEDDVEFGRRHSIYMITRYVLYVLAIAITLEIVGIGLNAFLVGSAALLVGVGMGLQNIFSDLISGLFLLFERPIEIGDVIEVDNIVGKIQVIKLRHTVVLDRDGVNLIVPNHKFITEKVINWSHNIEERRFMVQVGVDYNSDPKQVADILLSVAKENSFVIINKADFGSFVRLSNFGDSALEFQLYFWSRHSFIIENVKSDLRFRIFEEFKKHGVKIPFPQRDLHIRSGEIKS